MFPIGIYEGLWGLWGSIGSMEVSMVCRGLWGSLGTYGGLWKSTRVLTLPSPQGIHWFPWKGFNVSIPFTEMKLRPQRG